MMVVGVLAFVPAAWAGSWQAVVSDASLGSSDATQIDLGTGTATAFATDGPAGLGVAFAPDANTGLIVDAGATGATGQVTPVDLSSGSAFARASINIPNSPGNFVAVSPDGRLAYVTDPQDGKVFPIDLTTSPATVEPALSVGGNPEGVAFTPDGATAYVAENANTGGTAELIPITVATGAPGIPITGLGPHPFSIAMTPDGRLALVGDSSNGDVYPVSLPGGAVGTPIAVGGSVRGIAVLPDGSAAYAANGSSVTPIALPGLTPGSPIAMTGGAFAVGATPDSRTVYVTNDTGGTVTPVDVATRSAGTPVTVGSTPRGIAITPDQAPVAAFTVGPASPGVATAFDASSSTVRFGTIASYAWNFGDGQTETTSSPTTTHVYGAPGNYQATVTETDSDGTSVSGEVYTGQSAASVGGPSAETSRTVVVTNAPAPAVALSVTSLDFGAGGVGTASGPLSVTVSNTGSAALHPAHPTVSGPAAADFTITGDSCGGQTIAAGASCVLTVVFTPATAGARSAVLALSDDASGSPQTVTLGGVGVSTGAITGTVDDGSRAGQPPIAGAAVEICHSNLTGCAGVFTDASGRYQLDGLAPGRYEVTIDPPSGSTLSEGSRVADVLAGQTTDALTVLVHNVPLPAGVGITSGLGSSHGGNPTIFWNGPFQIDLPAIRPLPAHGTPDSSVATLIVVELTTAGTDQIVLGSTLSYLQSYDQAGNPSAATVVDDALPGLVPGGFDVVIGGLAAPVGQPVLTTGTTLAAATQISAQSTGLQELAHGAMTLHIVGLRSSATTTSATARRARPVASPADACSDADAALNSAISNSHKAVEALQAALMAVHDYRGDNYKEIIRLANQVHAADDEVIRTAEAESDAYDDEASACPEPTPPPSPPCDVFLAELTGCTNTGDLYTDPSGLVTTTRGVPIAGARVVLKRSATATGPFRAVPNRSVFMSPANRRNPDQTDIDGHFGWDVFPGFYRVSATRHGCVGTATSKARPVPPPVTNLHLTLRCPNLRRTPTTLTITGLRARGPDTVISVRARAVRGHPIGLVELTVNGRTVARAFLDQHGGNATLIAPTHLRRKARIVVRYAGNALFAPSGARETR